MTGKNLSYDGIGAVVASFFVEESVAVGAVVAMAEECSVAIAKQGVGFIGVVFDCDCPLASVQVGGFVTVKSEESLPIGAVSLCGDGLGGVQLADLDCVDSVSAFVVSTSTESATIYF